MAHTIALYRIYELPWTANAAEEQRFKRILRASAAALGVLAVLLAVLPVPQRDPAAIDEVPKRLARLVLERQAPPPPPPPVQPVVEELPPEPVPEPVVEQRVPEPEPVEPAPVVEQRVTPEPEPAAAPEPPPVDTVQVARERARGAGLLPFAEQLSALRDNDAARRLDRAAVVDVGAGAGTAPAAERSLITSRAGSGSGGIDTAALSRDTGGSGLAGRATTQVASPVGAAAAAQGAAASAGSAATAKAARSREEIERVFDRNKGAIYALYNRALRQNPSLQGKLVLTLTIAPDGRVTHCEVVSSELGDPALEQKLVQRVLLFEFEARDVEPVTTTKPIDFFPA